MKRKRVYFLSIGLLFGFLSCVLISGAMFDLLFGTRFVIPRDVLPTSSGFVDYYSIAASRIEEGDNREQVIQALSDAWFHCAYESPYVREDQTRFVQDNFFYGPQDFDRAIVVIVESHMNSQGDAIVSQVGSFESYTWCVTLNCLPPQFQKECAVIESGSH
jgi:hypothetical protein